MKDIFGKEIVPGDIVAYSVVESDSGVIRIGKVIKINDKPLHGRPRETMSIHSVTKKRRYDVLDEEAWDLELAYRVSSLQFPGQNRLIKLQEGQIPQEYVNLLNEIKV